MEYHKSIHPFSIQVSTYYVFHCNINDTTEKHSRLQKPLNFTFIVLNTLYIAHVIISTVPQKGGENTRWLNTIAILHDYLNSRAWKGTDELLHAAWGNKICKKRLEARLPFDIRCLKHAQTFPLLGSSMCRSRQVKPREIVCATEMFDLIESLIMRATVLFRQLWRTIAPVRARVQRIGKEGRAGDEGSQWPTWSMSGLTERGK